MRTFLISAVLAAGLGLAGAAPTLAAPANGAVISHAAEAGKVVEQAHWWRRHHHWRWYRRHHHRRWWW